MSEPKDQNTQQSASREDSATQGTSKPTRKSSPRSKAAAPEKASGEAGAASPRRRRAAAPRRRTKKAAAEAAESVAATEAAPVEKIVEAPVVVEPAPVAPTPVVPAPVVEAAAAEPVAQGAAKPRSRRRGGRGRGRRGDKDRTPAPELNAQVSSSAPAETPVAPVVVPVEKPAPVAPVRPAAVVPPRPIVREPVVKRPVAPPPPADVAETGTDASTETVTGIIRDIPLDEEADELDIDALAELELQAAEQAAELAAQETLAPPVAPAAMAGPTDEAVAGEMPPRRRRRRRGRGRRGRGGEGQPGQPGQPGQVQPQGGAAVVTPGEAPARREPGPRPQPQGRPQPPQVRPLPPQPRPPQARPQPPVPPVPVEALGEEEEEEIAEGTANKIMLVNLAQSDECRIAMLEEGRLQEFYVERTAALSHVGNVYKGVVTNIEPSIQAAFIDFGQGKNGFLHISDLQPQYFPGGGEAEDVGRKTPRRDRPPIQKCLRRNQEVVVQVTKEGIGTKGATLTTYVALPGRYLVMMPGMSRLGVSRKIEDEDARRRMRDVLNQLELPGEMGFILRTAGLDRNKRDLQRDLNYLVRLWKQVMKRKGGIKAPAELFKESDLVTRTLRDVVTTDVQEILIDSEPIAESARQFLRLLSPRLSERVKYYNASAPLFFKYGVEDEIAKMYSKRVPLRSGGSLVIESTEALVAIDVNSGKFREAPDPEESAFRINQEAAEEIARQLSLRDLGGVIICDFIDMHMERHRREIERALREALKKHKERAEILRMSRFGIIEMTRQRQRASIIRGMLVECPHCGGGGLIKSTETLMLEALRAIQTAATHPEVARIEVRVNPHVAQTLLNSKRQALAELEAESKRSIVVIPTPEAPTNKITVNCLDTRGWAVQVPLPKAMTNGGGPA